MKDVVDRTVVGEVPSATHFDTVEGTAGSLTLVQSRRSVALSWRNAKGKTGSEKSRAW